MYPFFSYFYRFFGRSSIGLLFHSRSDGVTLWLSCFSVCWRSSIGLLTPSKSSGVTLDPFSLMLNWFWWPWNQVVLVVWNEMCWKFFKVTLLGLRRRYPKGCLRFEKPWDNGLLSVALQFLVYFGGCRGQVMNCGRLVSFVVDWGCWNIELGDIESVLVSGLWFGVTLYQTRSRFGM